MVADASEPQTKQILPQRPPDWSELEIGEVGRPSKLTPKVINRICKALENCNPIMNACKLAGISQSTFKIWKNRAIKDGEPEYVAFLSRVNASIAKAQENLIKNVKDAARTDWRAAMAILERRHGSDWLKQEFVRMETTSQINVDIDVGINIEHLDLDLETKRKILGAMRRKKETEAAIDVDPNGLPEKTEE